MKPTVVIVEDDANIALAEKMILEEHYDVHVAHDGKEGLGLIKTLKPDLAILDVMMPAMDGFTLCKHIKSDENLKKTKVVMVTAKNQERDEAQGLELGADDYIMKPFEDIELLHVVRQVLNQA
ncbi:response regulator [Candidatus Woesearchaeota archaeon]|nr:MAG: response regulator [Candidatus Woesearchaeota archaeon]